MLREQVKTVIRKRCTYCGAVANLPSKEKDWEADTDTAHILRLVAEWGDEKCKAKDHMKLPGVKKRRYCYHCWRGLVAQLKEGLE